MIRTIARRGLAGMAGACILAPIAAQAWTFTPGLPCILTHRTPQAAIELTYDPTAPLYTVTITRDAPWPSTDVFSMRFDGPQGRVIGTDRHQLGTNGRSLSVADTGFGNVLDGLQYNRSTTATAGDASVTFSLEGAADPVARFRDCAASAPLSQALPGTRTSKFRAPASRLRGEHLI